MKEAVRKELQEIYRAFEKKDTQRIDLQRLRLYLQEERKAEHAHIFSSKLAALKEDSMDKNSFINYFAQSATTPSHFDAIFDSIDTDRSDCINTTELGQLVRKYGLNYSREDIQMMMQMASQDGQKISKAQLRAFLA